MGYRSDLDAAVARGDALELDKRDPFAKREKLISGVVSWRFCSILGLVAAIAHMVGQDWVSMGAWFLISFIWFLTSCDGKETKREKFKGLKQCSFLSYVWLLILCPVFPFVMARKQKEARFILACLLSLVFVTLVVMNFHALHFDCPFYEGLAFACGPVWVSAGAILMVTAREDKKKIPFIAPGITEDRHNRLERS